MQSKSLYEFGSDKESVFIYDSEPPRHWYNYLWNEQGYCMQVSQTGHGKSYYINEKSDMCRINKNDARYVYLRDDDSNVSWNIGEGPLLEPVSNYQCEHHIGFSRISSEKNNIKAELTMFVPVDGFHEVWKINLKNTGDTTRKISSFSAVSFEMEGFSYPRYYEMYRCCETFFDSELNGVYCKSSHPFAPHSRYNAYIASSEKVFRYDGNLHAFLGTLNTLTSLDASTEGMFARPATVVRNQDCTNSEAALFILGGVLEHKFTLEPGQSAEFTIIVGVSCNLEEAVDTRKEYIVPEKGQQALAQAIAKYKEKYHNLEITTPDEKINQMMNLWVKKQVDFCIVGKKGVRDNLQIAMALLMYRPEKAKEEILEVLRHQFQDGHCVLTWYPYDDTRYSDQPFWVVWAVLELIKETGDFSVLEEMIPYQDAGEGSVLNHMKVGIQRLLDDVGPNGLTKLFFADWNDALNVTTDAEAESVMLSEQLCLVLREFHILAEKIGEEDYSRYLKEQYQAMKDKINTYAWDGEWYSRVLTKDGAIGSKDSIGSKIYLNAQVWAVLAGIPDEEQLPLVMQAIDSMEHDFGFPINMPPYEEYSPHVGRMGGMLPGLFENGGVYCHASAFKVLMDCRQGRAKEAIRTLKKIMPDSEENPSSQSGAEPYVFTNCYSIHPKYYGKSYQSWTTGTSAWCMRGMYEGILGVLRDYDGLKIQPCFPEDWKEASVTRSFRGAVYHISYKNENKYKVPEIYLNGAPLEGNCLPVIEKGGVVQVEVRM